MASTNPSSPSQVAPPASVLVLITYRGKISDDDLRTVTVLASDGWSLLHVPYDMCPPWVQDQFANPTHVCLSWNPPTGDLKRMFRTLPEIDSPIWRNDVDQSLTSLYAQSFKVVLPLVSPDTAHWISGRRVLAKADKEDELRIRELNISFSCEDSPEHKSVVFSSADAGAMVLSRTIDGQLSMKTLESYLQDVVDALGQSQRLLSDGHGFGPVPWEIPDGAEYQYLAHSRHAIERRHTRDTKGASRPMCSSSVSREISGRCGGANRRGLRRRRQQNTRRDHSWSESSRAFRHILLNNPLCIAITSSVETSTLRHKATDSRQGKDVQEPASYAPYLLVRKPTKGAPCLEIPVPYPPDVTWWHDLFDRDRKAQPTASVATALAPYLESVILTNFRPMLVEEPRFSTRQRNQAGWTEWTGLQSEFMSDACLLLTNKLLVDPNLQGRVTARGVEMEIELVEGARTGRGAGTGTGMRTSKRTGSIMLDETLDMRIDMREISYPKEPIIGYWIAGHRFASSIEYHKQLRVGILNLTSQKVLMQESLVFSIAGKGPLILSETENEGLVFQPLATCLVHAIGKVDESHIENLWKAILLNSTTWAGASRPEWPPHGVVQLACDGIAAQVAKYDSSIPITMLSTIPNGEYDSQDTIRLRIEYTISPFDKIIYLHSLLEDIGRSIHRQSSNFFLPRGSLSVEEKEVMRMITENTRNLFEDAPIQRAQRERRGDKPSDVD
ncbi:hypothetical protein TREMEDRAFT_61611 [Tremella mesenterica DSM 1558]|uniref:uncharacterized protein n=1 Tax=Tremella mesenterica (strain ATCC 24925 / CBS 8224 / DSM 1558 / NBRC 9311 / NRRL Y-6157 / RJB 2259-6 / UBC 559-6) TaxID=578456 RepID=UPI0003F4A1F5|nr:uncharacterized protein TREMEDRAFT_61611 [Tremella mesenterica DSM 1558]EIW69841.1 hypothetical protein TREMEDRAFT_61611 [Tremella mesenterica DSM 1558]